MEPHNSKPMAQCWYPYHVENKVYTKQSDRYTPVPCGRCPECLQRRATMWGFRLRKQEEVSTSSLFITLTYSNENLNLTPNGFMTLQKKDYQDFMKRLRFFTTHNEKISYYACGEYGGNTRRPHYHAIIFNTNEQDIQKAWTLGQTHIGNVTGASIAYTVKYINKGRWTPLHKNDDRNPEFALMSKRMGANYLTDDVLDYHRKDLSKAYITIEDGIKIALPRYYKDKIFPITANDKQLQADPSLQLRLDENSKLRKKQQALIEALQASKPPLPLTDLERHEARKNAINNFKNKHNKRKDL